MRWSEASARAEAHRRWGYKRGHVIRGWARRHPQTRRCEVGYEVASVDRDPETRQREWRQVVVASAAGGWAEAFALADSRLDLRDDCPSPKRKTVFGMGGSAAVRAMAAEGLGLVQVCRVLHRHGMRLHPARLRRQFRLGVRGGTDDQPVPEIDPITLSALKREAGKPTGQLPEWAVEPRPARTPHQQAG